MPGRCEDKNKDKQRRRLIMLLSCIVWFLFFYAVFGAFYLSGVRVNVTSSLPHFLWLVRDIAEREVIISGDFVVVNPHELNSSDFSSTARQRYFNDRWPFIKQIGGIPGNIVRKICGITVLSADSEGNALPKFKLPVYLRDDEYWLTSDKKRGFDSRYFGPVKRDAIKAKAFPLFMYENAEGSAYKRANGSKEDKKK